MPSKKPRTPKERASLSLAKWGSTPKEREELRSKAEDRVFKERSKAAAKNRTKK